MTKKKTPFDAETTEVDSIAGVPQIHLGIPGLVTPTALFLDANLSLAEWTSLGKNIDAIGDSLRWWLGDWLNYGERGYGEMYSQAASETNLSPDTLGRYKHVSLRIEPQRRRIELSWGHHYLVAKLPAEEQASWLQLAINNKWDQLELKEAMRKKGHRKASEKEDGPIKDICPCCLAREGAVSICKQCFKSAGLVDADSSKRKKASAKKPKKKDGE